MAATTEADDYGAFVRRILAAYARRVSDRDIEALTGLVALARDVDDALGDAVVALRRAGYSWADIGRVSGITRQGAYQRWGRATSIE